MGKREKKIDPKVISAVMAEMGRKGGKVSNPNKGFGSTAKKAIKARWDAYYAANPEKLAAKLAKKKAGKKAKP